VTTETPMPAHPIPRDMAGASPLAIILSATFVQHQPLNRRSATYAGETIEIDVSTLADWAGAYV
jgi:transposase